MAWKHLEILWHCTRSDASRRLMLSQSSECGSTERMACCTPQGKKFTYKL